LGGYFLGIDVGSTTVKVVAVTPDREVLSHAYVRSHGRPRPTLLSAVRDVLAPLGDPPVRAVGVTGSGGGPIAGLLGARHVNELIAQTRSVGEFHPRARTVIEIGGQDSKLLALELDEATGGVRLLDFAMNALCAAGTGSFLDQQAERLGLDIEGEFESVALRSESPARIAGRCTVFAKSDMIHLQQQGTPLPDILAGLCLALARNFKAVIGRGRGVEPEVLFQGGVAANRAVLRAFEEVLGLERGTIVVPEHHRLMAAIGAALVTMDEPVNGSRFGGFGALEAAVRAGPAAPVTLAPLRLRVMNGGRPAAPVLPHTGLLPVYLGIDVGSISTCLALVDGEDRLVARRYLLTAGRPLDAVRQGLRELADEVGDRVRVVAVGATGSGRYLTGDFVGADVVRNEISAQARAAVAADPAVDTVIEIGGQDSKYIRLHNGVVVDFNMNHACAAGTGSFLEEQGERLKVDIRGEFSRLALGARAPVALGERCTVFMESDLIHHQQQGRHVDDLAAGLAYSIAQNYVNRVVDGRNIGQRILFQGGVAANSSVVAAFQQLLDRPVIVPPDHDLTGAIGAAILAREARSGSAAVSTHGWRTPASPAPPSPAPSSPAPPAAAGHPTGGPGSNGAEPGRGSPKVRSNSPAQSSPPSNFRGFNLDARAYASTTFECRACPNVCQVSRVTLGDDPPIFYGARCERFEEAGRSRADRSRGVPDWFADRMSLLLEGYDETATPAGRTIGIPRTLLFYDLFPYWLAFFRELGLDVVVSPPTNPALVRASQEVATVETCFPVKLVYGHVDALLSRGVDYVFLPGVVNRERISRGQTHAQYCPYIPAISYMVTSHLDFQARGAVPLNVAVEMSWVPEQRTQLRSLAPVLGVTARQVVRAAGAGREAQERYYDRVRARGREVLASVRPEDRAVVVVGRLYNTHDPGSNLDLPLKLRRLGVLPIPLDYLPVEQRDVSGRYGNMFWRSGQDILAAAEIIRDDPRLGAVYLTNFSCGPDSFLVGFFRRIMGQKPFLQLEVDDHTADAGILTRCEAFLESAG
jgi:predicted CoA-substrate-specific enzyme activase